MRLIKKLEQKFGRYAIKHLIVYILSAYGIGYVFYFMDGLNVVPGIYEMLGMNPALIYQGQVWRLVTWVCTIPQSPGIFLIFMFLMYYWIGQTLENIWGSFRYNLFMFSGILLQTLVPLILYPVSGLIAGFENALNLSASTYYLNLTSFLAFATIFPNQQIYVMFILPMKMKWLAIVDAVFLGWCIFQNIMYAVAFPAYRSFYISASVMIVVALANFLIYFLATRNYDRLKPKEIKRKRTYKQKVRQATARGTRHYCAICGRTEQTNPELQFRFCSKCKGNLEYCSDHLFTHEHRK